MQYCSSSFLLFLGSKNIKIRNEYQKLSKTIEQQALQRNVFYQCSILLLLLFLGTKNIKMRNKYQKLFKTIEQQALQRNVFYQSSILLLLLLLL